MRYVLTQFLLNIIRTANIGSTVDDADSGDLDRDNQEYVADRNLSDMPNSL